MSNHLISETYRRQLGSMARNAVMVLLADKASDDGTGIWASKQRMAEELGATKQTVITTIKALISDGLLREAGQRKCPNGYTVEYEINVSALAALPLVSSHQSSCLTGKAIRPVKQRNVTGKAVRPKPSRTPRIKPKEGARAHELPLGWVPKPFGPKTKSRGVVDGWPPGEFETQLEHFTAHHRSRGSKFKDWQDAWSTWVLNYRKFNRGSQNGRAATNHDEPQNAYVRAALSGQSRREAERAAAEFG